MVVCLRLQRFGKKKKPFYRIVAMDSRRARNSRCIEILGTYDPIKDSNPLNLMEDAVIKWLDQGAQPSETVNSLIKKANILKKWQSKKSDEKAKKKININRRITSKPEVENLRVDVTEVEKDSLQPKKKKTPEKGASKRKKASTVIKENDREYKLSKSADSKESSEPDNAS